MEVLTQKSVIKNGKIDHHQVVCGGCQLVQLMAQQTFANTGGVCQLRLLLVMVLLVQHVLCQRYLREVNLIVFQHQLVVIIVLQYLMIIVGQTEFLLMMAQETQSGNLIDVLQVMVRHHKTRHGQRQN